MESKKQKILILSLGTGIRTPDGKYPYKLANYRLGNSEDIVESPFVAESLMQEVKPDIILILGTVKSAWDAFYYKYYHQNHIGEAESEEIYEYLGNCVKEMGKDTPKDEIEEFQDYLNTLYAEKLQIGNNAAVRVCLIQYGLNDGELKHNYGKLKDELQEILKNSEDADIIELSFDITHSFRSMPLYNLVVIDYCRVLMPQKIRICHVFYGNLDVAYENGAIAQIVDLKDIVNILETTRGINEFHNTGNATSILKWFDENGVSQEDAFIGALRKFHKAMQLNQRKDLLVAFEQLLNEPLPEDKDVLVDAKGTIQERLREEIPETPYGIADPIERQKNKAKFQRHLANWCLKNGQVGLASIIAKESLRSFLVAIYQEDSDPDKYEDENARKRAEQILNYKIRTNSDNPNPLFEKYVLIEQKARKIRNTYAHNLEAEVMVGEGSETPEEILRDYIAVIEEFMSLGEAQLGSDITGIDPQESAEKLTLFITSSPVSKADRECLKSPGERVYYLQGSFGLPDKRAIRKERIKKLSRVIACKVEELIEACASVGLRIKFVYGSDISRDLVQNASLLLRSYLGDTREEVQLNYIILKPNIEAPSKKSREALVFDGVWDVNWANELNEEEREKIGTLINEFSWKELFFG